MSSIFFFQISAILKFLSYFFSPIFCPYLLICFILNFQVQFECDDFDDADELLFIYHHPNTDLNKRGSPEQTKFDHDHGFT